LTLRRVVVPATLLVAVVLAASGCGAVGRVTQGDPAHGKELFLASTPKGSCAACHTLADAKSQGTIGPNLDDAYSSVKEQGFSEQTMADIVRGQIAYPEPPMPPDIYRGQDASDVALYVAKCAGNASCGVNAETSKPAPTTTTPTTTSGGGTKAPAKPDGKTVFASAGCGGCHTLKAAGSSGNVGPDLDQLKPSEPTVEHQVEVGGGAMPAFKGRLTDAEIRAVADFVAENAGK
jgi:mono/diheme cytochrome c family protein